ncbi:hypothetical protein [Bacillus sp. CGMCC 1.16541]|uniref:hypothetical protein n=1 Tax=Bacillus sp. CGMCC 1.16541 TaxID=2185143 RepID=UPI000D72A210|nr:hypothetical protein [Bacillus sp. CGMCC 1.16541]
MKRLKYKKILLLIMLLLPWFSFPLLGKPALKRFLPAGLFISILVFFENMVAKKRKWWVYHETIHPRVTGDFPLIWGPFLIGSMWILKATYGKFYLYMLLNIAVDSFFTYPLVSTFQKLGISSLVKLKRYQLSLLFFFKSALLYGFQLMIERMKRMRESSSTNQPE